MNALEVSVHEPRQSTVNTLRFQVLYSTVSIENFFLLSSSENHLKIVKNQPLPVASTDAAPVYITTSFLYTQCDICQSSAVVYRVVVPPQYGHICLASGDVHNCTQSLHQFTQSDLDRFMIVYKPDNESNAQFGKYNDSFIFELRYHGFGLKPPLTGLFSIFAAQYEPLILSEKQLWVGIGGTETIPHRYFRSVIVQPQTFHIITLPQFGELFMMSSSQQQSSTVEESDIYTLEQLKNNQFQYRHYNNVTRRHCSDSFTFVAINSTHSVTETIVIAIRQRRNHLLGLWRETKSVLSQDNFVFTSQDFNVLSDFCLVFVQFTLQSQPVLGNLRLYHPPLHTFEQLGNGSVFTAEDVRDGRLWYTANDYLSSVTSGQVKAIETMKFYLSDPKNFRDPSEHVNSKKRIDFEVTFLRPPEETLPISTVFITRDIYVLSWLPQRQGFGYIFQPMDIRVESTPSLHERNISVKILVKESPRRGWIQRDGQPVTEFYLYQLQNGEIHYVPKNWWIWMTTSDSFTISILLETNNAAFFINTVYNHSMALVWSWVNPTHTSYTVRESASILEIEFRRDLDNGSCPNYESSFSLSFSPTSSATITTTNCSSSSNNSNDDGGRKIGDACIESPHITFPPNVCSVTVAIELEQDKVFESREQLFMYITDCSNCVSNITNTRPITIIIDDTQDYSFVDVTARRTQYMVDECSREINVREPVGELVIGITRTGNMNHEVNVSCYTRPDTAKDNVDFEHLDRDSSIITFAPNQTHSRCTVGVYDDTMYERKERFYVYVVAAGGLVNSALEETPLCVYIVYDPNDAPILSFQSQPVIVREKRSSNFAILRHGVNLHLDTTVCYQVNETVTTATSNIDFNLMCGDTQINDPWCVTFAPNETKIICTFFAHLDELLEETEFVFLELLHGLEYGELGWPTGLNITVLDATQPVHIGLVSNVFNINEREGLERFPIIRSGSLNRPNEILCKLKPINTTVQIIDEMNADFIAPSTPETVTFQPFNTTEYCSMWLKDDDIYEGVETLYLELANAPHDPQVDISRRRAIIYIHDDNDKPKVWFSSDNYTVQEPISNFEVDRRCAILTLQRGGDISKSLTVSYTTLQDSARPGEHYVPVNGTVHFQPAELTRNLTVPILASEDSHEVSFEVKLLTNATVFDDHFPLSMTEEEEEEQTKASVIILNTPLIGVLFPDKPVVVSLLPDGSYSTDTSLYYNSPLVCVDSCDEDYESVSEDNMSYISYCYDQQIDSRLTQYTWFVSSSNDPFYYRPVEQATIYTTFDGKVLEPVYLNRNVNVRCSAQAVTTLGTRGGTRTSDSVHLSQSILTPGTCDSVSSFSEIYKNDGFTGHPEELLRLTVVLKHYDNYIPLISSRPFELSDPDQFRLLLTRPFNRDQHSCSSLVESAPHKASFLSPLFTSSLDTSHSATTRAIKSQLLYQHFNASKCQWIFRVWIPLSLLTDSTVCDAQISTEGQTMTLTLPLYYAYIHLNHDGGISVLPPPESDSSRIRATWPLGHKLSIPFNTYPHTANGDINNTSTTYIYPVMTQLTRGRLTITFYSISNSTVLIRHVEVIRGDTKIQGKLIYSSSSYMQSSSSSAMDGSTTIHQAWMVTQIPGDQEEPILLQLWRECPDGAITCATSPLTFTWFIATTDTLETRIAPQMTGLMRLSNGLIEGSVWLRTYFHLRVNHMIQLDSATLYLCTDALDNTTCVYSQIWTIQHNDEQVTVAEGFDMKLINQTLRSFDFTFKDTPLKQLDLTGRFELHIKCSIKNLSDVTQSPIPPIILTFHLSDSQTGGSTAAGISNNIALLASSITIFLTAAVLVGVVLFAVALHCRWQARRKCNVPPIITENGHIDSSMEQRNQNTSNSAASILKKSSSTTSFPTAERFRAIVQKQEQSSPATVRNTTSQLTGQINRNPFLSKSLPNLLLASGKEGKLCRKRRLRKNVRVKAVYTLQASLDKRRAKGGEDSNMGGAWKALGRGVNLPLNRGKHLGETVMESDDTHDHVIKNSFHTTPPIQVCVQPLTGEVAMTEPSTSTDKQQQQQQELELDSQQSIEP